MRHPAHGGHIYNHGYQFHIWHAGMSAFIIASAWLLPNCIFQMELRIECLRRQLNINRFGTSVSRKTKAADMLENNTMRSHPSPSYPTPSHAPYPPLQLLQLPPPQTSASPSFKPTLSKPRAPPLHSGDSKRPFQLYRAHSMRRGSMSPTRGGFSAHEMT